MKKSILKADLLGFYEDEIEGVMDLPLPIKELLTKVNRKVCNYNREIGFIVIHYVGAVSSAYNNAIYFENVNLERSAHYFVDAKEIYRVVKDNDIAWHCGSKTGYKHEFCRNTNSIGVEMCCYKKANGELDVSPAVENRTIHLVKALMNFYKIPIQGVVRHFDVANKLCPAPFITDNNRWVTFKKRL